MEGLGYTWEELVRGSRLEEPCLSLRLLEGSAALVGGHHGKCSIAEECLAEHGFPLSVPCCLCPVLMWGLSLLSPAIKAEPLLHQVLGSPSIFSSSPEAGSRKCHLRVTSKLGSWCGHTNAECLGPALREHVVSQLRCLP